MVKLTLLYGHPTDTAAFDDHYANTRDSLARQIPNLQRFIPNFATGDVTIFAFEVG